MPSPTKGDTTAIIRTPKPKIVKLSRQPPKEPLAKCLSLPQLLKLIGSYARYFVGHAAQHGEHARVHSVAKEIHRAVGHAVVDPVRVIAARRIPEQIVLLAAPSEVTYHGYHAAR